MGGWLGTESGVRNFHTLNSLETRIRPLRSTLYFLATSFWCRKIFGIP